MRSPVGRKPLGLIRAPLILSLGTICSSDLVGWPSCVNSRPGGVNGSGGHVAGATPCCLT
eukprot:2698349-Alexandrium_andersonii.AAC.1